MCVAVPGKVIKIEDNTAQVEIMGNVVDANISLAKVKLGDYVLIHAGCVIEVLKEESALELISIFEDLEEAVNGNA